MFPDHINADGLGVWICKVDGTRHRDGPCDCAALAAFTRAEWDAAYQRAALLWHEIEAAKTGDAQKDAIARALLQFRRKDLEAL